MRVTRRFWATTGLAGFLAGGAILLAQPLLLVGAAGVGAFILAQQAAFVRSISWITDSLTVQQDVSPTTTITEADVDVVVSASVPTATPVTLSIATTPPLAASDGRQARTLQLAVGETTTSQSFQLQWPVAGRYDFEQATVTATDRFGFFETTLSKGTTPTVTVNPRQPRDVHIGQGGAQITAPFGPQQADDQGTGFDPAEIREYVPGDPARQIDWKSTARMNSPHVRTFEAESNITTTLLVDHRSMMATGDHGETKLDYGRQVALGFVADARQQSTPCGIYAVGDGGLTTERPLNAIKEHYEQLRNLIHTISVTYQDDSSTAGVTDEVGQHTVSPRDARTRATRLKHDSSSFAQQLRPFFTTVTEYQQRIDEKPLYHTVRTHPPDSAGNNLLVIITDDTDRGEIRETVQLARQHYTQVLVFLTPTVLFEPGTLSDISTAYSRYLDFESFRQSLMHTNDVIAFEVGPRDRLNAILNSRNTTKTPNRGQNA